MDDILRALRQIATPQCLAAAEGLQAVADTAVYFDLHLRSAGLTADHAMILASALRAHQRRPAPHLRSFSASYNPELTNAGTMALAEAFPDTMAELGLVGCALTDRSGAAILAWADRAQQPQMICIEQNPFSSEFKARASQLRNTKAGLMLVV
jgi:hypothetical protein